VHTSPYADGYQSLVNGMSIGYWPTDKDAIAAGKLADKHGFKSRDEVQEYLACQDKPPTLSYADTAEQEEDGEEVEVEVDAEEVSVVVNTETGTPQVDAQVDAQEDAADASAESKYTVIDVDSDDDTSVISQKKRKLSDRFRDLEECKKNGYLTDDEYKAKRAMLLALI
jgi:hypothetical protein